MANINSLYGAKYTTAKTLPPKGHKGKIVQVDVETITARDKTVKTRLVLMVTGLKKPLVLNATNAQTLADKYGEESDGWLGKTVALTLAKVDFNGQKVDGIRLSV